MILIKCIAFNENVWNLYEFPFLKNWKVYLPNVQIQLVFSIKLKFKFQVNIKNALKCEFFIMHCVKLK